MASNGVFNVYWQSEAMKFAIANPPNGKQYFDLMLYVSNRWFNLIPQNKSNLITYLNDNLTPYDGSQYAISFHFRPFLVMQKTLETSLWKPLSWDSDWLNYMEPDKQTMQTIRGTFGTGIQSYTTFNARKISDYTFAVIPNLLPTGADISDGLYPYGSQWQGVQTEPLTGYSITNLASTNFHETTSVRKPNLIWSVSEHRTNFNDLGEPIITTMSWTVPDFSTFGTDLAPRTAYSYPPLQTPMISTDNFGDISNTRGIGGVYWFLSARRL